MIFLSKPDVIYKESFIEGVREFQQEGRMLNYPIRSMQDDFTAFLRRLAEQEDRTKLSPDRVPSTEFWLIEGDETHGIYIGTLSLRHELNDYLTRIGGHIGYQIRPSKRRQGYGTTLLCLGLEKARDIGLTRVLVTCDENNIGSKKVIEGNGGRFENALPVAGGPVKKLRYWIELA